MSVTGKINFSVYIFSVFGGLKKSLYRQAHLLTVMKKVILSLLILGLIGIVGCSGPLAGKAVETPVAKCAMIEEGKVLAVDFTGEGDFDTYPNRCSGNILSKNVCLGDEGSYRISRETVTCEFGCDEVAADCLPPPPSVRGCTDPGGLNFNPQATEDDGSCQYVSEDGCNPNHPEKCLSAAECLGIGLYWWSDGTCLKFPEPAGAAVPSVQGDSSSPLEENPPAAGRGPTVTISSSTFTPATITVRSGETITWQNNDAIEHTVTFDLLDVDEVVPDGSTIQVAFSEPGEFTYFCQFHPGMEGTVIVEAGE